MRDLIIFAAGGTAGHIFPAAALASELKNYGLTTRLIVDKRGSKFIQKDNESFDDMITLPISRLNWIYFLKSPYLLLKSLYTIKNAKQVICFGGYTSLFPFLAALILRKERIIYQLDSHITRLNRLLIPFANKVFYGFAQTNLKNYKKSYCFGIPVRKGFEFSFIKKDKTLNIAIIGGSLGSNYWQSLISQAMEFIPDHIRSSISLKIQTNQSIDFLKKFNLSSLEKQEFYDTAKLFTASHLIIARAGAASIAEISSIARAAYLVPWNRSIENHQYKNAKNYSHFKGAEFGNDPKQLAEYIIKIAESNEFFYQICANASLSLPQFAKNKVSAFLLNSQKLKHIPSYLQQL